MIATKLALDQYILRPALGQLVAPIVVTSDSCVYTKQEQMEPGVVRVLSFPPGERTSGIRGSGSCAPYWCLHISIKV